MSAPKALKAMSLRDSLAKTVRLLTKSGVEVQFRGHIPCVHARGNKVQRLVLPELNDNASPELIQALQGFLDHEVGHIFYTPFATAERFANGNRVRHSLCNIIEDIRLEKLLPRDLPGTRENLERMYDSVMDSYFGPAAQHAKDPNISKSEAFSCVMVVALRALAGQKAFQDYMDKHELWPFFMPLIKRMPNISRRLRDMEDFKDVQRLVEDILEAMKPEPKDPDEASLDPNAQPEKDDGASSAGDNDDGDDSDDEEGGGCGHGDGEGTDDEEGDDDDSGSCKGGPGDDDGDSDDSDEEGDDGKASKGKDTDDSTKDGDTPSDDDLKGDSDQSNSGKEGKGNRSLRDALALLEPTSRRALYLYNKKGKSVAEIANDLNKKEDETVDMLATARKRLRDLLNGGN